MAHPVPMPGSSASSGWEVEFTRLAREVQGRIGLLVRDLTARFQAAGLMCDVQVRQTPRGTTTFLALIGERGLLCLVDMTLLDGMELAREPGAVLDIRLLDASGDIAARCSPRLPEGVSGLHATTDGVLAMSQVGPRATAVYLLVMCVFGLPASTSRGSESVVR